MAVSQGVVNRFILVCEPVFLTLAIPGWYVEYCQGGSSFAAKGGGKVVVANPLALHKFIASQEAIAGFSVEDTSMAIGAVNPSGFSSAPRASEGA